MHISKKRYPFTRLLQSNLKCNDKFPASILPCIRNPLSGILLFYFFQISDGGLGFPGFEHETSGNQHINTCLEQLSGIF